MKKIITLLVFTCLSLNSLATSDYSVTTTLRSYPTGLSVAGDYGKSFKLWQGENKILYGYVRPSLNFQTSLLVNYAKIQLDFYPISFLGFYIAKVKGWRNLNELQGFDCSSLNCGSNLSKYQWGSKMALAYKKWRLVNFFNMEELNYDDPSKTIAEETSNLIVEDQDTLINNITVIGYQLNKSVMVGFLNSYYETINTKQSSNMLMALASYKFGNWTYQTAIGNFHNRENKNHLSTLFILKWAGKKGLKLF